MHSPEYTLIEKVSEGFSTVVYRGRRKSDDRAVTLKMPRNEYPSPKEVARIEHEHQLLKLFNDDRIIKSYGVERFGHRPALITEDFGGQSLHSLLGSSQLDMEAKLKIAVSLAGALGVLWQAHVLHKDIKPSNVACNLSTGETKLIDFGIATRLEREVQRFVRPDAIEGTLAYMSPERTGRMNRDVDHRSDLYSLGVMLYEALVGAPPFVAQDQLEMVHSHIARMPVPPHERESSIPLVLSQIVMKLLSKEADGRYQHAHGLAADLMVCLEQWRSRGRIDTFPLGREDVSDVLRIPQKLYGRDEHVEKLLAGFEHARSGRPTLLLVAGAAGIGKSVLVHEVYKPIARYKGDFVSGKFDQLHRGVPFASFTQAFRDLVRQLLSEPPEELAAWKRKLLAAVGTNGQVLLDVLPELERVIGPQPPVQALGPAEVQVRFGNVFKSFIQVFCTPERPLGVFLDDLQWVDPASLWLIRYLLTSLEGLPLLVIGAYRDHEVDELHPLRGMLQELKKVGLEPTEVHLGPIEKPSVRDLLGDALPGAEREQVEALAEQLFSKTHGNPLFLTQLLFEWHRSKLISLEPTTKKWTWDMGAIVAAPVADNVVEFMIAKLRSFDAETQRLVSLAACIGHQFDRSTLSTVANRTPAEIAEQLWPVLQSGLVVPLDADYRLVSAATADAEADFQVTYRFLHDRVQQAAYALIESDQKQEVHLRIGRRLREKLTDASDADARFEAVTHLNAGASRMTDPKERLELARANLAAGATAKAATAFGAARDFLGAGIAVLDAASWDVHYDLMFALHREHAECTYLSGRAEEADVALEELLAKAKTDRHRAEIHRMRILMYMGMSRPADGLAAGRAGLAIFGITLPDAVPEIIEAFMKELAVIDKAVEQRSLDSLLDAPMMGDNEQLIMGLLNDLFPICFWVNPPLCAVVTAKEVSLTLTHGIAKTSAFGFAGFGNILVAMTGRVEDAIRFGETGLKIAEKLDYREGIPKVLHIFACYVVFGRPFRIGAEYARRAREVGLEIGSLFYSSNASYHATSLPYVMGESLERINEELKTGLAVMARTKEVTTLGAFYWLRQAVAALQGRTHAPTSMSDDSFDEAQRLAYEQSINNNAIVFLYNLYKIELAVWFDEPEAALERAMQVETLAGMAPGTFYTEETFFFSSLLLTARYAAAPPEEQEKILELLDRLIAKVEVDAKNCPENYRHRPRLLAAERARIKGDVSAAAELYDEAIALAHEGGFVQIEALANERCAKMYLSRGRQKIARTYMMDARTGYDQWGAKAKVEQLDKLFPELSAPAPARRGGSTTSTTTQHRTLSGTVSTTVMGGISLDVPSVIKASQALSGEISFDKLMLRMMSVVAENAGAESGVLILNQDNDLRIFAESSAQAGVTVHQQPVALSDHARIVRGIVHYVTRTHETAVLDDASADGPFTKDPDVQSRKPKSILCMPVLHQGQLKGVLYLENSLTAGTFTVERTTLLNVLCSQMAISIENAHVYANLETLVEMRTRELREAQARLVKLEKQATEVRMAGGFAHEMRNALASARLRLSVVYEKSGGKETSICDDTADKLKQLFLLSQANMPSALPAATDLFRRIHENEKKVFSVLSRISVDIERALKVTGTILDYSRQGFETPGTAPIDITRLVENVLGGADRELARAGAEATMHVEPSCQLFGNESHFYSLLSNLVLNACDAVADVAGEREKKITVDVRRSDGNVLFEVKDTGVGIPPENMAKLFEPFFSTKPNSGTGLGLSMVEKLVSLYGGTIDVQSEIDQGTTVSVLVPSHVPR